MEKLRHFLEHGKWKQLKKSDWIVLALGGILLLVIAMPSGSGKNKNTVISTEGAKQETTAQDYSSVTQKEGEEDAYVVYLEEKLETVLSQMDGVGKVKVMITVADNGETVVEKDTASTTTTTQESDSTGGSRTVTEGDTTQSTVYVETGDETYPYIQKEKLPSIEGVVIVAEGGGNSMVVTNISEAVKALFPVEAHRVKVLKMGNTE